MKSKIITFGLIVGTRGFFNAELAAQGRKDLIQVIEECGYKYVILPEDATPTSAVETLEDAQKCARLFRNHQDEIDGIIVCLPNFGDELGIVNTISLARLNVPVLVQASDDDPDKVDVHSRRDAFCGKISVCNNFYQYGIPFTDTTYHSCSINSDVFRQDLHRFASICRVVTGLRNARIGAIGARPPAFQTMRASEKLLQASGITVITVDHSDIIFRALRMKDDAPEVKQKLDSIYAYGTIPDRIPGVHVIRQAKYGVVVENWMAENEVDAAGIQCWTSIQENYGCATCLTMSMLGQQLIPCACEVDIAGVISMYALSLATLKPSAILDWNNNYGQDRNKCACTHCGNYPKDFISNEIEISELDVLGETLGRENCFGAIKGKVASGPMTYFRISTDDVQGKIKTYTGEGEFSDDPFPMDGCIAVARVNELQKLLKYICKNGFEHHVAMVRSHCADIVREAAENYLGWEVYHHEA